MLARVARREVDILVGTQMVTKGHDFPGVTLVGVLCADTGLNLPDFRASERTFQLLAQVAGRAGRGDRPGRVLVQTYRPGAPAVVAAAAHDYAQLLRGRVRRRAPSSAYPPHGRLIAVRIDGPDADQVAGDAASGSAQLAATVAQRPEIVGVEVLGPVAGAARAAARAHALADLAARRRSRTRCAGWRAVCRLGRAAARRIRVARWTSTRCRAL